MTAADWRLRGACKDDPELFFRTSKRGIKRAKDLCAICPVKAQCLPWALDTNDRFGIAAGMTPEERDLLLVAMGRAA